MISGVVLAAGRASRFGSTKQVVEVGGRPMVLHAVDALRAGGVDELLVVVGNEAEAVESVLPPDVQVVRNARWKEGQATSLGAGLHAVDDASEGAVVLMADQPGIGPDDVRALVSAFRRTRQAIVRLRFTDGPGPALLSREIFAEVGHLHGDVGARVLMASHPEWVLDVDVDRPAPADIDEPGDLP